MRVSLGDLVDRLGIVNSKIWALENEIRWMKELEIPIEEVGRRAILIRNLNKERVAYKNAIDEVSEEFFGDIKIDHTSAYRANQMVNAENALLVQRLLSRLRKRHPEVWKKLQSESLLISRPKSKRFSKKAK